MPRWHSGASGGPRSRLGRAALLLSPWADDRRKLPAVFDGNENAAPPDQGDGLGAQAVPVVPDAGERWDGGAVPVGLRGAEYQAHDGVLPRQSPTGLSCV